jgi:hypothetical protein
MANWLRDLVVKEISLVDKPANPGAKVLLAKRDDEIAKDMYQVSRFADLISSIGYLLSSSESEAKYEGDNSAVPSALRSWLKQGAGIFNAMATEEINELLAVTTAKRAFDAAARRRDAKSGAAEGDGSFPIENASDLKNAMRAVGRSKNPAKTKAHIRARAKALGLTSMLSDAFKREDTALSKFIDLFKSFGRATSALSESVKSIVDDKEVANKADLIDETIKQFSEHVEDELEKTLSGDEPGAENGEDAMSPELKKALGLADAATEADAIAAIAKRDLDLEIAKAGMTADEMSHHDALKSDDDKKAFRALSREDRKARMVKRVDDLPAHVVKALQDAEETKKRLAVLEAKDELVTFQKRAVEIGLTEGQGELLMKAHKGDKEALTKIENAIKGLNEQIATGKLFTEFGSAQGGNADDPYAEITAKAEVLKKANPKLTIEKAKAQVIEDPANRDLVKRYQDQHRAKITKAA